MKRRKFGKTRNATKDALGLVAEKVAGVLLKKITNLPEITYYLKR